jgi:hypothetical protein
MHLLFNVYGLWSCRFAEVALGSEFYFKHTCVLIVRSASIHLLSLAVHDGLQCFHELSVDDQPSFRCTIEVPNLRCGGVAAL